MHIHATPMNTATVNPYAAAAESQRKADVRRRLMSAAMDLEGIAAPDEATVVGRLRNGRHGEAFTEDEYHSGEAIGDSDFS